MNRKALPFRLKFCQEEQRSLIRSTEPVKGAHPGNHGLLTEREGTCIYEGHVLC